MESSHANTHTHTHISWQAAASAAVMSSMIQEMQSHPVLLLSSLVVLTAYSLLRKTRMKHPPAVPGVPVLGNLLQLGEKKPHKTFSAWAEKYGVIYTIKTGADTLVIITSSELAKEAMITKYSSISTRKMSKALSILTADKTMVATSDYNDEHRMLKKLVVTNLLGSVPQKANRKLRESACHHMIDGLFNETLEKSEHLVNIRDIIRKALFPFVMHQVLGRDPDSVFVKEFGRNVSRWEMFEALVIDPLKSVIEVDWRDFFPALRMIPNRTVENSVREVHIRIKAIVGALIAEQKMLLANGKKPDCFLDILLTEATYLSEKQLLMSAWEPIIESADTTLVSIEWVMYELAKNSAVQEKLYQEILGVVGSRIVTEDDLPKLKYLDAIVKETLRKYPPVSLLPPRHVDEDITIGGYDIKKGWQIVINIYGINHHKDTWSKPELWDPERVLNDESIDLGYKDHRILPFGTGKRMCAGVMQAMFIIPAFVAQLVQHFKWTLPPEDEIKNDEDTVYLTTHKLYPLEAIGKRRCSSRLPLSPIP